MRLIEARRAATEDANNAWETLVTARARISSFTAAVRANRIALEGVRQEALVGSRTVLDVLDAEQELLDSQVNLVRAERDETVAQYQLMSAIGRLTAPSLNLETEYYDPSRQSVFPPGRSSRVIFNAPSRLRIWSPSAKFFALRASLRRSMSSCTSPATS